ncbi:UV radiation resistance-associated protein-like [Glandiceps talaboti]
MSSTDNPARMMHVDLITQQRRLRHLRSLSARNITVERSKGEKDQLMETYFTMHVSQNSKAFFTSEKIQNSLNPTWRSFDLGKSDLSVDTALPNCYIRVLGGHGEDFKLIFEWKVNLSGLKYLGEKIYKDGKRYPPNSLIFGMFEGFYGAPELTKVLKNDRSAIYQSTLEVDNSAVKQSYTLSSLTRIYTNQRAIKQTEVTVCKVRSAIETQLKLSRDKTKLLAERETLRLRTHLMHEEIKRQRTQLHRQRESQYRESQKIDSKARDVIIKREKLRKDREKMQEDKRHHVEKREWVIQLASQLTMRRRQLVSELSFIYPIVELPNNTHLICGVKLPNAEEYSGTDDTTIATALGYTCHLMIKMAQFLQLPLRYPMYHRGSRSIIRDHITDKLQERDRDFPLYSKGKERFQFNYAVYLLNKNVAQLRFYCGLPTTDLRVTLPNLKTLLELRWGVKFETLNQMTVYAEKSQGVAKTTSHYPNNTQLPQAANFQPPLPPRTIVGSPRGSPRPSPHASPRASPHASPRSSPRASPLRRRKDYTDSADSPPPEYTATGYSGPEEHLGTVLSPPTSRSERVRELAGVVDMNYQRVLDSDEVGREAIMMEEEPINMDVVDARMSDFVSDSGEELEERGSTEHLSCATEGSARRKTSIPNATKTVERTFKESPRKIFTQSPPDTDEDSTENQLQNSASDTNKYFDPLGARVQGEDACDVGKLENDAKLLLENASALDGLDDISSRTDALSSSRTSSFRFQSPSHQKSEPVENLSGNSRN